MQVARLLAHGELDVLTFTSPSAVEALQAAGAPGGAAVTAVIGSTTAAAAARAGFRVDVVPTGAGMAELVEALGRFVQERRGAAGP